MNTSDLNEPVQILKQAVLGYPTVVRNVALAKASKSYLDTIAAHGGSRGPGALRDALETSLKALHRTARAEVAKSEADAVAPATSGFWDFSTSPTAAQASADDTRVLAAQAIAAAAARRIDQFGQNASDPAVMDLAIRAVVENHEYGATATFETLSARSAASAAENGYAWPTDLASERAVADADEINASLRPEGAASNFDGRRNDPRAVASPMPAVTGFSGAGVPSFPAGVVSGGVAKGK